MPTPTAEPAVDPTQDINPEEFFNKVFGPASSGPAPAEPAPAPEPKAAPAPAAKTEPAVEPKPAATETKAEPEIPGQIDRILKGEEKPASTDPEEAKTDAETEAAIKNAPPHQKTALAAMHQKLKEERQTQRKLQERIKELESKTGTPDPELGQLKGKLEELTKTNSEYESELKLARLEATSQYKQAVTAPLQEITATVKAMADKYEVPAKELIEAFAIQDPTRRNEAVSNLISEFVEADRLDMYAMAKKYAEVEKQGKFLRDNREEALKLIQEREGQQREALTAKFKETYVKSLESSRERVREHIPFFQKVEGNDAWNQKIDSVENFIRGVDPEKLSIQDRTDMLVQASVTPLVVELLGVYAKKAQQLQEALSKYEAATPGAGASGKKATEPAEDSGADFMTILRKKAGV